MRYWFRTKAVRDRILFTIFILFVFQIGTYIPLPYINKISTNNSSSDFSNLLNLSSGGSLNRFGLFMLGISPYITANILISLLQKTVPFFKSKAKTQAGRSSLGQYTRVLTCIFAGLQGYGILFSPFIMMNEHLGIEVSSVNSERILVLALIVCGSLFVSYLGEKIDESGVGQGASVLIGTGILSTVFYQVKNIVNLYPVFYRTGQLSEYFKQVFFFSLLFLGILIASYFINKIEFKYPIQSMANKYRVEAHYFPIKLLASSVMPVIFSSAFLSVCSIISQANNLNWTWTQYSTPIGMIVYVGLIFLFSFIYNFIQIDSTEIQTYFQEGGIYFIGHRQSDTSKFISSKLFKITLVGAPVLTLVATSSMIGDYFLGQHFSLQLTGVSLLIVVGVFYEIVHQVKGLTSKHNYKEIFVKYD